MAKYQKIYELLRGAKPTIPIMVGEVKAINGNNCSVQIGDFIYEDVCLKINDDNNANKCVLQPAIGSSVIIVDFTGEMRALAVLAVEDIAQIDFIQSSLKVVVSSNGVHIENQNQNLKDAINDLITEVQKIIVIQGTSPNVPALEIIKQRFNQILC